MTDGKPQKDCCHACDTALYGPTAGTWHFMNGRQTMLVCATCGNKRCPKASNHVLECTGSNEPGQQGSIYAA